MKEKAYEIIGQTGLNTILSMAQPLQKRKDIVDRMQAGQSVVLHTQSAGHGLTLTRATLLFTSPTYKLSIPTVQSPYLPRWSNQKTR